MKDMVSILPKAMLGLCLLALVLSGCQDAALTERLAQLRGELHLLEKQIEDERERLLQLQEQQREAEINAQLVLTLHSSSQYSLNWREGFPFLEGVLRNDLEHPISRTVVEITRTRGLDVEAREKLTIVFDPILLPGEEMRFSAEASPFVWGFQEPENGNHGFILDEVILANGRKFRDEFAERTRRDEKLIQLEAAITDLRFRHGAIYSEILQLEN